MCVSDHAELRALHFLARAYVFTASGSPANLASVRAAVRVVREHPELRDRLWSNVRRFRDGLLKRGYRIGPTESPIVPIFTGEEQRTIALWQELLAEGLYVNLIVPPGCPRDECVLRASCSAAHTVEHITRALEIFERVAWRSLGRQASTASRSSPPGDTRPAVCGEALAQVERGDDTQALAQPIHATHKSFSGQLDVPPAIERQRPAEAVRDEIAGDGGQARHRLRDANHDRRTADRQTNRFEDVAGGRRDGDDRRT